MNDLFIELGTIMIVAAIGSLIARFFKQPMIPSYIIIGIIMGPILGFIKNQDAIATFSELGIVFLLFMVGLEIEFHRLRDVGMVTMLGGSLQIFLLFLAGYGVSRVLGFEAGSALYLGIMLAFSSTMVVIKIFSDKKELDTLHGRIVLGMLLVQDFFAIVCLAFLSTTGGATIFESILEMFIKGSVLFIGIGLTARYILPKVFKFAARNAELLLLTSLSVCFSMAILFGKSGISPAIGAFIAGIILGNLPYNLEIEGRARSLRDFFSTLFFVSLGLQFVYWDIPNVIGTIVVFFFFTILFKPVVTLIICNVFGYKTRTSFLAGISLAQVSEFALIIIALATNIGVISNRIMTITVALAIVTTTLTSYFIKYDDLIYRKLSKFLKVFNKFEKHTKNLEFIPEDRKDGIDIILVGYSRIGYSIFKKLKDLRKEFLVIDFNPECIKKLINAHVPCIYGDISDVEILNKINLRKAKMIISTIPDLRSNQLLVQKTKQVNKEAMIFCTAFHVDDALELYNMGADYVILPHFLGGDHFSIILEDVSEDLSKLIHRKIDHIQELNKHSSKGSHGPLFRRPHRSA